MSLRNYVIENYIKHLEKYIMPVLRDEVKKDKRDSGQYEYISLPADKFIEDLDNLDKLLPSTGSFNFIDVGCGIGSKLALASYYGTYDRKMNLHGIEITEEYVRVAKSLNPTSHVFVGDAILHHYGNYDVIYFYQPLFNQSLQNKMEERIIKTAKPGAYIIAHLTSYEWRLNDIRLQRIDNTNIYRKVNKKAKRK